MFCHVGVLLFPILLASLAGAQPVSIGPNKHSCHVYVLDIEEGRKLFEKLTVADAGQATDWKTAAGKIEKIVGRFEAEVGEEVVTTRSYRLPGTGLYVTATVYYTDETMDLSFSMLQGLAIAKKPVASAIYQPGASVTEVNLDKSTYKVRTKQRILIHGRPWLAGLECQCMSTEDYQRTLRKNENRAGSIAGAAGGISVRQPLLRL